MPNKSLYNFMVQQITKHLSLVDQEPNSLIHSGIIWSRIFRSKPALLLTGSLFFQPAPKLNDLPCTECIFNQAVAEFVQIRCGKSEICRQFRNSSVFFTMQPQYPYMLCPVEKLTHINVKSCATGINFLSKLIAFVPAVSCVIIAQISTHCTIFPKCVTSRRCG